MEHNRKRHQAREAARVQEIASAYSLTSVDSSWVPRHTQVATRRSTGEGGVECAFTDRGLLKRERYCKVVLQNMAE